MGFVKDAAKVGTFGLTGLLLSKKKKKPDTAVKPMMTLTNQPAERPVSMIGSSRGVF